MPRLTDSTIPAYRLHRQSGQAIVTLSGRDFLLGKHGTAASMAEYNRVAAEWLAAGRQNPAAALADLTISELIARYKVHVEAYYRHADGTPTGEATTIQHALRLLRIMYGSTPAAQFGPLRLKAVREAMIAPRDGRPGWARRSINGQVKRIRRLFKWAVENELVPAGVSHGLAAVAPLMAGRCEARETDPIKPVPDAFVEAVFPYVSPQVKAMIELQLFTGARPGEICLMRTIDIDTAGTVWTYTPSSHKTQHHGHARSIRLGPKAQAVLRTFLKADTQAFIFSPAEAEQARRAAAHDARKTPPSCGNVPGSNRSRKPKRPPADHYNVDSYRRAIARACERAFPAPEGLPAEDAAKWRREHHWHPHQLRHSAATKIRREHGLEMARIILGHRNINVTELYAEADTAKATMVMSEIG